MKFTLKNAREQKGLKTREVAQLLNIDQALISKFESGIRKPTKEQIIKLATLLEIDLEELLILWLKEKILNEIKSEQLALYALRLVEKELLTSAVVVPKTNGILQTIFDDITILQEQFKNLNPFDLRRITKQIELEFTFECNSINGNSMNFEETKLVINEGITIDEKSMKEHLEIINFYEALQYCKNLVQRKSVFDEKEFLQLHTILLRDIPNENAGKYVEKQIIKEIELFFQWLEMSKNTLQSILLASEVHLKIMSILPFYNYNNQMAFLATNLILLQNNLYFALLKEDIAIKQSYVAVLEKSLIENNAQDFAKFIALQQKSTLTYALTL